MSPTTEPADTPTPLTDARESVVGAAIARALRRAPVAFREEAAEVARFLKNFNAGDAAADLPGGPLADIAIDDRGASKSIAATNGRVTATFSEVDGRRAVSLAHEGRTATAAAATGLDAVDFLALELGNLGACHAPAGPR